MSNPLFGMFGNMGMNPMTGMMQPIAMGPMPLPRSMLMKNVELALPISAAGVSRAMTACMIDCVAPTPNPANAADTSSRAPFTAKASMTKPATSETRQ